MDWSSKAFQLSALRTELRDRLSMSLRDMYVAGSGRELFARMRDIDEIRFVSGAYSDVFFR